MVAKNIARARALETRDALDAHARAEWSRTIEARARTLDAYRDAATVASYVSIGSEVGTRGLLRDALTDAKRVAVPVTDAKAHRLDLARFDGFTRTEPGAYDIPEPRPVVKVDLHEIDVVFVPGVAFDARGHRLGYGRGYFDRLLAATAATKVGLAFEAQIVAEVPIEKHDVALDLIVTEKRTVEPEG